MSRNVRICVAFLLEVIFVRVSAGFLHRDALKTVPNIINSYGYPSETHKIRTEDGYYVTTFRIPNEVNDVSAKTRFPVLLVHGLMGSSFDFISTGPGNALAYLLSNEGFDVWLLNCRGTRYSMKHESLESSDAEYWDFTWHEIGIYDVPATIDYILKTTGYAKLFHMGMSQGSTSFFVMLSERPEYNSKIIAHISFAPAALLCYTGNSLYRLTSIPEMFSIYATTLQYLGSFNAGPNRPVLSLLMPVWCNCTKKVCSLCKRLINTLMDLRHTPMNLTFVSLLLGHFPAGAPIKSLIHYAQLIQSCEFRKYKKNFFDNPAEYNLANVNTTLYTFYAENDSIQDPRDTKNFRAKLPDGFKEMHMVKDYGHSDFFLSADAKWRVYEKVIAIVKRYTI